MKRIIVLLFLLSLSPVTGFAGDTAGSIYRHATPAPLDAAYQAVYAALEAEHFWVVFETDMGARMEKMRARWGDGYNRNGLDAVRSIVFCNLDWTQRMANADPDLLAICPLHLTFYRRGDETVVVMPRPSALAAGSPGRDEAKALEDALRQILDAALDSL